MIPQAFPSPEPKPDRKKVGPATGGQHGRRRALFARNAVVHASQLRDHPPLDLDGRAKGRQDGSQLASMESRSTPSCRYYCLQGGLDRLIQLTGPIDINARPYVVVRQDRISEALQASVGRGYSAGDVLETEGTVVGSVDFRV